MSEIKQVIIVRTRFPDGKGGQYKPRTGKLASQAAHASMKIFFDMATTLTVYDSQTKSTSYKFVINNLPEPMYTWITGSFAKIVVSVRSEEELLDLAEKARQAGLVHAIIQDEGRTEFKGIPTYTALAIGPDLAEKIDPITEHLKLL